ncbi:MAG: hypothetical protein KC777_23350 [Cyanobacteria bacterium HKST-UBA02]|nr:hypothetical protein [Cyanobacteria bacterium HKST-UBA02]
MNPCMFCREPIDVNSVSCPCCRRCVVGLYSVQCPDCAEPVDFRLASCPFCRCDLGDTDPPGGSEPDDPSGAPVPRHPRPPVREAEIALPLPTETMDSP